MSYASYTDIQSEFKSLTFSATTAVTSTEVTEFTTQESALIDCIVGSRYETPVTGTSSLSLLKSICIELVTNRIKKIMAVKTGTDATTQDSAQKEFTAMDKLKMIRDGKILLKDATLLSSDAGITSYASINSDVTLTFQRNTDQW